MRNMTLYYNKLEEWVKLECYKLVTSTSHGVLKVTQIENKSVGRIQNLVSCESMKHKRDIIHSRKWRIRSTFPNSIYQITVRREYIMCYIIHSLVIWRDEIVGGWLYLYVPLLSIAKSAFLDVNYMVSPVELQGWSFCFVAAFKLNRKRKKNICSWSFFNISNSR